MTPEQRTRSKRLTGHARWEEAMRDGSSDGGWLIGTGMHHEGSGILDLTNASVAGVLLEMYCRSVGGDVDVVTGRNGNKDRKYRLRLGGSGGLWVSEPCFSLGEACTCALLDLWGAS